MFTVQPLFSPHSSLFYNLNCHNNISNITLLSYYIYIQTKTMINIQHISGYKTLQFSFKLHHKNQFPPPISGSMYKLMGIDSFKYSQCNYLQINRQFLPLCLNKDIKIVRDHGTSLHEISRRKYFSIEKTIHPSLVNERNIL